MSLFLSSVASTACDVLLDAVQSSSKKQKVDEKSTTRTKTIGIYIAGAQEDGYSHVGPFKQGTNLTFYW